MWRAYANQSSSGCYRNVPGVALYYTSLQHVRRTVQTFFPTFAEQKTQVVSAGRVSTLVVLSPMGNLFAGGVTRTAISAILNPLTVVKARYEVSFFPRMCTSATNCVDLWGLIQSCRSPNSLMAYGNLGITSWIYQIEQLLQLQINPTSPVSDASRRSQNILPRIHGHGNARCSLCGSISCCI